MIRLIIAVAALAALGGCASNATALNSFITTLSNTNCHVTGTLTAQVGAMNPGSGATLSTTIDCPNGAAPAAAKPAPATNAPA